jgi:zinc protease
LIYRSKASFLGLPFVHIAVAEIGQPGVKRHVARGWIAIGDVAYGGLLAIGGVAVGSVAIGGVGLGLLSLGGLGIGLLALGGMAVGGWALGGCAVGFYSAMGGLAVAWHSALGGAAIASDYAVGGAAYARHANDPVAREFLAKSTFHGLFRPPMREARWLLLLVLLPVLAALWRLVVGRPESEGSTGRPPR